MYLCGSGDYEGPFSRPVSTLYSIPSGWGMVEGDAPWDLDKCEIGPLDSLLLLGARGCLLFVLWKTFDLMRYEFPGEEEPVPGGLILILIWRVGIE